MNLFVVGVNHRTAPLELREGLAIPARDLTEALCSFHTNFDISETVILSTCNRVEFYVSSSSPPKALQGITDFLCYHSRLDPAVFQPTLYHFSEEEAAKHLFRVTAGLDSMILGESEITAQVKQAYLTASAQGTTGPVLNRLFQKALHSAKVVRSQTRIAEGQASIGSVVVALTKQLYGDRLKGCEVLLWGAGKAAEATVRHLIKSGIRQLWVVNRTQLKAQDLASLCQGGWLSWDQALKHLAHVDIAIVCTQAPHYVIGEEDIATMMLQRGSRSLCIIDLAVPRNVNPLLAQQSGLQLYNIDHLQSIAQAAFTQRNQELEHCEAIIQGQIKHFAWGWKRFSDKEAIPCRLVGSLPSV